MGVPWTSDSTGESPDPWCALSGVGRFWVQNELMDEGRRRFHLSRGRTLREVERDGSYLEQYEYGYLFVLQRNPWRLAMMGTSVQSHPSLVAWVDDEETWVEIAGEPATVVPHPHGATHGNSGLRTLLHPTWLARAEALGARATSADGAIHLDGRIMGSEMLAPAIASIGLDYYRCEYDEQLAVVTDFAGFIDGEMATQASVGSLHVLSHG